MQEDGESTSCSPGFLSNQPLTDEADGWEAILSGSPGGYPPRPPQIRTCGFPASGSSHHRFASASCLGRGVSRAGGSG